VDEDELAPAIAESAVHAAIADRQPCSRHALRGLERIREAPSSPVLPLAAAVPAHLVWSLDDAVCAAVLAAPFGQATPDALAVVRSVARSALEPEHAGRVRRQTARIASELPVAGFPRASRRLAVACAVVAADRGAAADVAELLLPAYAFRLGPPPPELVGPFPRLRSYDS
jgi:hypothetical protein